MRSIPRGIWIARWGSIAAVSVATESSVGFIVPLSCVLALSACEPVPRVDPTFEHERPTEEPSRVETLVGPPLPTTVESAHCGDPERERKGEAMQVAATAAMDGTLRVVLTGYSYYCSPTPNFAARMDPDRGIVVTEVAPPPKAPISRCICSHDVRLRIENLPAGEHDLLVFSRRGEARDLVRVGMTAVKMSRPGSL